MYCTGFFCVVFVLCLLHIDSWAETSPTKPVEKSEGNTTLSMFLKGAQESYSQLIKMTLKLVNQYLWLKDILIILISLLVLYLCSVSFFATDSL